MRNMTNNQQQDLGLSLDLVVQQLNTAHTYIGQGQPLEALRLAAEAQRKAVDLKIAASTQGLDELVHGANKSLAISHEILARSEYSGVASTPFTPECTLESSARGHLQAAAEKYREADHAFIEFDSSFRTPQEQSIKQGWLNLLFPSWTDTAYKLAVDAHNRGNAILGRVDIKKPDKQVTLQGLRTWDTALEHYRAVLEIAAKAGQNGVTISPDYGSNSQRGLIDVAKAANGFANAVGEPKLAEKYTQIQQNLAVAK